MYGLLNYMLLSLLASLLDTVPGMVAFLTALTVFLGALGCLVWVLVKRGNRHLKRVEENTGLLPNARAARLRKRYLG